MKIHFIDQAIISLQNVVGAYHGGEWHIEYGGVVLLLANPKRARTEAQPNVYGCFLFCVGMFVVKSGDRIAAVETISLFASSQSSRVFMYVCCGDSVFVVL